MVSAPKSFGSAINLNKIPVLGLVPESSITGSPPASPVNGQFWFDSTVGRGYIREAGAWVLLSQTGAELLANKGATNGYASLVSGTVPIAQIPTGTTGTTVPFGNDGRFSDNRIPTDASVTGGTAGAGVKIAAGTITDANVNALNKDGLAATPSLRTIGTGAQQAMAGNTTLSSIAAPTGAVSLNNQLLTNVAAPVSAGDAVNKTYVDSLSAGLDPKASVRFATVVNLAGTYTATGGTSGRGQLTAMANTAIDGVTLAAGNRVLVKDQTAQAANGIYVITTLGTGANGVWDRATDFDTDAEVTPGAFTFVEEGTVNADTGWVLATNAPITVGGASGTNLSFTQFSSAASLTAGLGLTKTGTTLDVGGTANRISVIADSVDIDSAYIGQASITTLGTITTGTWTGTSIAVANGGTGATTAAAARTNLGIGGVAIPAKYAADLLALVAGTEQVITHSLNTLDVHASFRTVADGYDVVLSWRVIGVNTIGVTADIAYGAGAVRTVVVG